MKLRKEIVEVIEKYLGDRIDELDKAEKSIKKFLENIGISYVEDLELKDLLSLLIVYKGDRPGDVFTGDVAQVLASDVPNKIHKGANDPVIFPARNRSQRKYFDNIVEKALKIDKDINFQYNKTGMSIRKKHHTKLRLDRCFLYKDKELISHVIFYKIEDINELIKRLPYEIAETRTIGEYGGDGMVRISNVPEEEVIKILETTYLGIGNEDDYKGLDKEK